MKAPVYQEVEQPKPIGLPTLYPQGPQPFGEDVAKGAQSLAKGVEQIAEVQEKFKQDADLANVNDGIAAITKARSDKLAQLKQMKGRDAVAASGPMLEDLRKERDKISDSLANPTQQRLFKLHSEPVLTTAHEVTNEFVTSQVEVGKNAAFQAQRDESLRAISNEPSGKAGDAVFKAETEKMRGVVGAEVDRQLTAGLDASTASVVHSAHYNAYLAEAAGRRLDVLAARHDAVGIQKFWEQPGVKASLGKLAGHYEALVDETIRKERSYATAQGILNDFPLVENDPNIHLVNENAALHAVDSPDFQIPAEERERVRTLVKEGIRDRKAGQDQVNTTMFNKALQSVFTGGLNAVDPDVKQYLQNANNGGDALWVRVVKVARSLAEDDYNAPPSLAQIAIAGRLRAGMADNWGYWASQDPGVLYTMYAGKGDQGLTPRQLQEAYGELSQTKKEAQVKIGQGVGPVANAEILRQGRRAGLFPDSKPEYWTNEQAARFNYIATIIQQKEYAARSRSTVPVGYDDIQKWVAAELKPGAIPSKGRLFGDRNINKAEYATDPELQNKGLWIPDEELADIRQQLQKGGLKGTYENIVEVYRQRHQGE